MGRKRFFRVIEHNEGKRIDVFLTENSDMSRSSVQKLIKEKQVELNGKVNIKASSIISVGDEILFSIPKQDINSIKAENLNLDIIYQDSDIIVVNKPVGMVVHPSLGHDRGTLVNALLYHYRNLSQINGALRPGIVHRLDKDTSGLLVVAKNDFAHVSLSAQFKQKTVKRMYLALVYGRVENAKGTITTLIGRDLRNRLKMTVLNDEGKLAVTHYKVLKYYGDFTLLSLGLETGRTHQIRVHLNHLGFPVIGDRTYGNKISKKAFNGGQFLHAHAIEIYHPRTQKILKFLAHLPSDRVTFLQKLK